MFFGTLREKMIDLTEVEIIFISIIFFDYSYMKMIAIICILLLLFSCQNNEKMSLKK